MTAETSCLGSNFNGLSGILRQTQKLMPNNLTSKSVKSDVNKNDIYFSLCPVSS
jgi:hypothetical protein